MDWNTVSDKGSLSPVVTGGSFPVDKAAGSKADHLTASGAEVKNMWSRDPPSFV
jgi:hypothetical protein